VKLQLASAPRCVAADGRELPLAPRDALLLAWLALEGPTPRTRLAALLWPDSAPEAGRNALRQRLFQLRKLVGADLVSGSAQLALVDGVTHDLADAPSVLAGERFDLGADVEAWLARVRASCGERARQHLVAEADVAEQARDWSAALRCAQQLMLLDPLREDAHRRLMRVHYLAGDRAAALQAFDQCEALLKHEVGTRPSAETLTLLETITRAEAPRTDAVQAVPASVLLPPRMIGRDAELAHVQQGWAAGQVVAVIGEAGLGKTRLLQTFAQTTPGVVGAAGRPGDAGVPFATLARLLRSVVQRPHSTASVSEALPAGTRSEIARVLPELDPSPTRAPGEGQRLVMQRALRSLLDAQDGLTGLWVDDLHFADEASLEMLRALIDDEAAADRAQTGARDGVQDSRVPLRWLLAYRPGEVGSPVQSLHDALVEHARLAPVVLRPLDEAALAALVDSLGLPGISGVALAPGLARRTGGNPLFVLETLKQAWVERKLAQLADTSTLPRPLSVGRLIERRLAQLSPGALALARVASIAGADFSIAMAEHVLQASAMQFADALNELEAAQVMRGNAFAHDLVFDAVRASVPAAIAAHTHERIAAWLEPREAEPARIAQHWIDAGQPQRALDWLQRAADKARAALRYKEYVAFMERKSAILEAAGDRAGAFDALLRAAEEFVNTDRAVAGGEQLSARLLQLAQTPQQRIHALLHRSTFEREVVSAAQAVASAREALAQSTRLGEPALIALSQQSLATALFVDDHLAEAARYFEACVGWVDTHGRAEDRSELHGNLAGLYDNLGRLDEALPHHELAFKLAYDSGNQSNAIVVLGNLACNRIDAGDIAAARDHLQRSLQLMALYDEFGANRGAHYSMLSLCACVDGRYDRALEHVTLAQQLMREHARSYLPMGILREALVWRHLGQWARVQRLLERPEVQDADKLAAPLTVALLRRHMALALGQPAPDLAPSLALLTGDARPDLRLPLLLEQAMDMPLTAGLAQIDGVIEQARRLQHAGTLLAGHVRAAQLALRADASRAAAHAHAAFALLPRVQSVVLLPAEPWLHCAQALRAHGETGLADQLLTQGRAWIERTAREHVPEEFRESFLHRNPVNHALLQLAARLPSAA
jgi:DNA-binding SARP family transcriptional activator